MGALSEIITFTIKCRVAYMQKNKYEEVRLEAGDGGTSWGPFNAVDAEYLRTKMIEKQVIIICDLLMNILPSNSLWNPKMTLEKIYDNMFNKQYFCINIITISYFIFSYL